MREIIRGAFVAFGLKILGAGCSFFLYLLVARVMGAQDAGIFFLGLTISTIACVVGRFGLDSSIMRSIAASAAKQDWSELKGAYKKGLLIVFGGTSGAALVVYQLNDWLAKEMFSKPDLSPVLAWLSVSIVPLGIAIYHGYALQGLKRIAMATLLLNVFVPAFSIVGVVMLAHYLTPSGVAIAYMAAATIACAISFYIWQRETSDISMVDSSFPTMELINSCVPLFWVSICQMIITWAPVLALGLWADAKDVGIFSAATRTAMLVSFVLMAVNAISAPKFAEAYKRDDLESVGRMARGSAALVTLLASPVLAAFIIFPNAIMGMFGEEFVAGGRALSIIAVGHFINVITGSVGYVLIMCGQERIMRNNLIINAFIMAVLCIICVPIFGAIGAAFAVTITLTTQNVVAVAMVRSKLRIMTVPLFMPIAEQRKIKKSNKERA